MPAWLDAAAVLSVSIAVVSSAKVKEEAKVKRIINMNIRLKVGLTDLIRFESFIK